MKEFRKPLTLRLRAYLARSIEPETFLQVDPSPPQMPHLSKRLLEPMTLSQPAFTHWPWTQTEVESGVHGVPSAT